MSGSETGIMASREPFTVALQKTPPPAPPQIAFQNVRLSYNPDGSPVYKSIDELPISYHQSPPADLAGERPVLSPAMEFSGDQLRRKRGRPRKYGPESSMALALIPASENSTFGKSSGSFSPTSLPHSGPGMSLSSFKKARGRPLGSVNKRRTESIGSAALGFTPHVITVKAGEDVSSKIMSFSQNGPRAVCILSANGAISNVTLRQPATSGGTVTYEGRFEILSLSGSFMLSEVGGQRSRTGGLSVSLAGQDGRVLGGSVSGLLTAASPVQVVVGSFMTEAGKEGGSPGGRTDAAAAASAPPNFHTPPQPTGGCSPSVMTGDLGQSSGSPPSPPNRGLGPLGNPHTISVPTMTWK